MKDENAVFAFLRGGKFFEGRPKTGLFYCLKFTIMKKKVIAKAKMLKAAVKKYEGSRADMKADMKAAKKMVAKKKK